MNRFTLRARAAMVLLIVMLMPAVAWAQETLTVYDGTNTNQCLPMYVYYFDDYTRSQYVIPAADLDDIEGGTITAIKYYTSYADTYTTKPSVDIYLKEVSGTTISAFEDKSTATIVYQGTVTFANGETTITFSTPYSYNGGSLLIGCENATDAGYLNMSFYGQTVSGGSVSGSNGSSTASVSATQQNFIPKTTFIYTPAVTTTPKPTDLTVTALTASAATIGWNSTASKWNLRYKETEATEWTTVEDLNTKTYTITGLMANTTYNVQVQAVYDEGTSKWASTPFTTALGIPYRQYFETNNIPAEWMLYSGLLADVQADPTKLISGKNDYSWQFSSSNGAYITFSGYAAKGTKNWLVTPAVELGLASNLSFDVSLRGGYWGTGDLQTNNADDRFIVLASIDGGANWTQLALWDNASSERVLNDIPSSGQNILINFPASFAGKSVVVAFYAESTVTNNANRLFIDNVIFDDANRCVEPTDLTSSNVTSRTATVGWTSDGDLFNLQYKAAGDADWTTVNGITATTYGLTGLTPKTVYTFRVQTDCGTSQSIWSEEATFTTQFGIPFTETFANSSRPDGWTGYSTLMSGVLDGTTTLSEYTNNGAWGITDSSGDYYAYVNLKSQYGKQWLVTPDIIMDVANCQLTFDLRLVDSDKTGSDDQFAVLVTQDGGTTWAQLALWNNSGSARVFNNISYNGEQVALDLSAYYGKTIRLAFYAESTVNNADNVIRIDNVSADVKPAVDAHRPQNLTVSNITKNSATITWDADAAVTQWNIKYGSRKSTYRYTTTSSTNSCDLTLLGAGTEYEVLVQAIGGDGESRWSNTVFVTEFPSDRCNISYTLKSKNEYGWNGTVMKVVDNNTGIEVASLTLAAGQAETTGTIELCNGRSYGFVWIPQDYYGDCSYSFRDVNGDEFLYADAGKTGEKTSWWYTMDCTIVNCHQPTNLQADEVGFYSVTASWTPGDADQEKWEVVCRYNPETPSATIDGTEVTTTSYTFSDLNTDYTYYIFVRGVKGEEKSKWSRCLQVRTKNAKALPSDVFAYNETFYTADVEWTVNGIETKWDLRYAVSGGYWTTINGITMADGQNSPTCHLTGLTPDTQYYVQVRAVYDDNSTGSWTASEDFWTEDDKAMPTDLTLDFYAENPLTTQSATLTWEKNGVETKWNVRYRKAAYAEEVYFDDFENGLGAWTVYTEGTAPQENGWYAFTANTQFEAHSGSQFASAWSWYNNTVYNADNWLITPQINLQGSIKFWVRTDDNWPDSYAVLLSTTGKEKTDFTTTLKAMAAAPATDEWEQVSIDLSSYAGQQGYVAIHHVSNDQNYLFIDDAGLYINESPAGEWQTMEAPATSTQCTITGLDSGTGYEVQVQAVYDDESTGDWTDSYTFRTIGVVPLVDDDSESEMKNSEMVAALAELNEPVDIALYGRTLYKDGEWNTICLPFNVVLEGSPLEGAVAKTLTSATMTGTTVSLTFGEAVTTLQAGIPYIIKWTKAEGYDEADAATRDITAPVFTDVTVVSGLPADRTITKADGHVKFIGYYDAFNINPTDNADIYYMTAGNTLKHTGKTRTLKACRAYFQFSENIVNSSRQFVLDFGDDSTTGVSEMRNEEGEMRGGDEEMRNGGEWYTIGGVKLDRQPTKKGVYIHHGRKEVVK